MVQYSLQLKLVLGVPQHKVEHKKDPLVLFTIQFCTMDDVTKQLRVRFSGVGQEDQGGSQTITIPPQQRTIFGRGQMSNGEEYDAAFAATVAAVAYAISAREDEKLASQEKQVTERLASQKKPVAINESAAAPSLKSPSRRGESTKKPTEGSKISRWFSGKEPVEDDDDGEQAANVSVRRPLKPAEKKPEGVTSGQKGVDSTSSIKKDPSFARRLPEKKGSKKFEQEEAIQKVAPEVRPTTSFPRDKKESKKFEQEQATQRAPPTARPTSSYSGRGSGAGTASVAASSEAETMANAWEKEKLAKIKKQYDETMKTITEWEAEKKGKAMRQKELKERDSERKRAKALEEYNDEMRRIDKVAAASRLTAEEKRRNAESKVREKAERIRSTGKLPASCACF